MLWLHGKSNSAIISEEMLFLKVAEPLPELHQVVVEGGECSRQGHLGVEMILMAVGATNINVSVGDGDEGGDQVIRGQVGQIRDIKDMYTSYLSILVHHHMNQAHKKYTTKCVNSR